MWRRQIEVGHSFQIPFAGRNNLHLPSHPLNRTRLHGNPPGAHGQKRGLNSLFPISTAPFNCIRFRLTIHSAIFHLTASLYSVYHLFLHYFDFVERGLVNFKVKLRFQTSLVIPTLSTETKML